MYNIWFDLLNVNHNKVVICCNNITVLVKNEVESPFDPKYKEKEDMIEECSEVRDNAWKAGKSKKMNYEKVYTEVFLDLPQEAQAIARIFIYKFVRTQMTMLNGRSCRTMNRSRIIQWSSGKIPEIFSKMMLIFLGIVIRWMWIIMNCGQQYLFHLWRANHKCWQDCKAKDNELLHLILIHEQG